MEIKLSSGLFILESQIFLGGREREGGRRKRGGNIPCNSLAISENLPCHITFKTAFSLILALPLHTLSMRLRDLHQVPVEGISMRNLVRFHVTHHDRLVAITIAWSRKAAAHSSSGLANKPGTRTLKYVSTSPNNSAKHFVSARSSVYVSCQDFSATRVLRLIVCWGCRWP